MEVPLEARAKIKADNKRLFVCAQSLFHATKYMVKENGQFCLLLFSKEGVLLAIYHYDQMNEWLSEHKINVWTNWSEDYSGPNIFSVGIK
ncbi:hypothetical protein JZU71_02995, partial [bacterium]|nr:hypothetical protein [bacterium]